MNTIITKDDIRRANRPTQAEIDQAVAAEFALERDHDLLSTIARLDDHNFGRVFDVRDNEVI